MPERPGRLHIDTLRLRVPARDAASGRKAALDLVHGLAERSPELLSGPARGVAIGGLKVRVPAPRVGAGPAVTHAVTSALSRAVARAGRGR